MNGLSRLIGRESARALLASDIDIKYITEVPDSYLTKDLGIAKNKVRLLRAAVDLSVEIWVKSEQRASVTQPREAFELFRRLSNLAHEELHVIFLSTGKEVIAYREVFRGGMAICPADPRVIWRQAVLMGASGVIMGHNHPSGTTKPSEQDQELTRRCVHIGEIMGIPLLDHLIVAGNNFCTMRTTEPQLWQS